MIHLDLHDPRPIYEQVVDQLEMLIAILQPYGQQRACDGSVLLGRGILERLFGDTVCVCEHRTSQ